MNIFPQKHCSLFHSEAAFISPYNISKGIYFNYKIAMRSSTNVPTQKSGRIRIQPGKIALFFLSLFLFILGVALMKESAAALTPVLSALSVRNPADSLGFGWLFAYLILSGSPVAASSLTFFHTGIIDQESAFRMLIGSRMGAGFIVLLIGFIYVLRGRDRSTSLSMGLLSPPEPLTAIPPSARLHTLPP